MITIRNRTRILLSACWWGCTLLSLLVSACSTQPPALISTRSTSPLSATVSAGQAWVTAPPLKGNQYGDWYFLRARVTSYNILFYQLCLRDRRSGDDGWAFYEKTIDENGLEYPTIVLNRKIYQNAVMKELVGVMLTKEQLGEARIDGLNLQVQGDFDTMNVWLQPAYVNGFLLLVEEYMQGEQTS